MPLLDRLTALLAEVIGPGGSPGGPGADPKETGPVSKETGPEALATAAILVHVARVDGIVTARERERLSALLAQRFGLGAAATRVLVERADAADRDADDVADLIERLGHGLDLARREELLRFAYGIAASDGPPGEFEEDLVWRLGHLLGLGEERIAAVRATAVPA